jgi:SAM-dependent methyltransferase
MVRALEEVRRVLKPGGILIDVRPLNGQWPIEVASTREVEETGHVDDFPEPLSMDRASNEAMKEVEIRGWFQREQEEFFSFLYSWDTPSEMEEFVVEDWSDFIGLSEATKMATRAVWATGDADSRVQVRVKILIARWKVVKG